MEFNRCHIAGRFSERKFTPTNVWQREIEQMDRFSHYIKFGLVNHDKFAKLFLYTVLYTTVMNSIS